MHRDLKPANVMITNDGRVKVLDFGLAKTAQPTSSPNVTQALTVESPLSSAGEVLGTVPYMAPEQVRGEGADARTDVFAFGVVLYELLAGHRPFAGPTQADVSSAILRDTPQSISTARKDIPNDLDRIVTRCLDKAPSKRYASAAELHAELKRLARDLDHATSGPAAASTSASAPPSIAVLPFSNMSADPENEYFSDGLTEELLNVLAKNPQLKVAGRTSSFAFKGKHEDLREIGQKLGVATLLEGSVRKAGSRVRITAQLIKVADGFHLWSDTYDRVLDDIFAVQDDIARSVSSALQVTLLGKPKAAANGNAKTYELVLRANQLTRQITGPSLAQAIVLYREALDADPKDARAWAGLAKALTYQAFYGHADVDQSRRAARDAAERAQALDPELPDAHMVMGWILCSLEFQWKAGIASLRRALELEPGASEAMLTLGVYLASFGSPEEGRPLVKRALELDPLDPNAHFNAARFEGWAGNFPGAHEELLKTIELSPHMAGTQTLLGLASVQMGQAARAIPEIEREQQPGYRDYGLTVAYHALGRTDQADAALERLISHGEEWAFQIACAYAYRGEIDPAFHWLDRAFELHDSGAALTKVSPWFASLHGDPRWRQFLEKIGLADA